MKLDGIERIKQPEKKVLDFLTFLEKETQIKFNFLTLSGIWAMVTTEMHNTTICIPAEFYWLIMQNIPLAIEMRYCPCEQCNNITYVDVLYKGKDYLEYAEDVKNKIRKVVPGIDIYTSDLTE